MNLTVDQTWLIYYLKCARFLFLGFILSNKIKIWNVIGPHSLNFNSSYFCCWEKSLWGKTNLGFLKPCRVSWLLSLYQMMNANGSSTWCACLYIVLCTGTYPVDTIKGKQTYWLCANKPWHEKRIAVSELYSPCPLPVALLSSLTALNRFCQYSLLQ